MSAPGYTKTETQSVELELPTATRQCSYNLQLEYPPHRQENLAATVSEARWTLPDAGCLAFGVFCPFALHRKAKQTARGTESVEKKRVKLTYALSSTRRRFKWPQILRETRTIRILFLMPRIAFRPKRSASTKLRRPTALCVPRLALRASLDIERTATKCAFPLSA